MFLIVIILVSLFIGAFLHRIYTRLFKKPEPVEYLKNALLSYILMRCGNIDQNFTVDYKSMDGSTLPSFSGYSTANACFSYIVPIYDQIYGPFLGKKMDEKNNAIYKYINKHLNSEEDVFDIFSKFIDEIQAESKEKEI
jgi:hypothetical protein